MAPRFSVLLPTHNRSDVVGNAIESALAQTEADFELLVAGDGCTDDTASVVSSFADERIRWFDLPKAQGFGYANRNVALREARGELIAYIAHDDLLLPDHLELMDRAFDRSGVEWAYSRGLWMDDKGVAVPLAVDLRRPDDLREFMDIRNSITMTSVVHRRSSLDRYGYWPEDLPKGGDWVLWRRMVGPSEGANLAYLPTVTCIHFRADWRDPTDWGPPPLREWLAEAATSWWPEGLQVGIGPDAPPQTEVWRRLAADPVGLSGLMRDGVVDVIDGFARGAPESHRAREQEAKRADALQVRADSSQVRADGLARELESLGLQAQRLRQALASVRSTNKTILGSRSWRATAPLRGLGRAMRRVLGRNWT